MSFFVPPSGTCSWIKLSASGRFQELEWDHGNGLVRYDDARKSVKEMLGLIIGKDACSKTNDENDKSGEFIHLHQILMASCSTYLKV